MKFISRSYPILSLYGALHLQHHLSHVHASTHQPQNHSPPKRILVGGGGGGGGGGVISYEIFLGIAVYIAAFTSFDEDFIVNWSNKPLIMSIHWNCMLYM